MSVLFSFSELLPDINNFLRHVLKKENLSSLAEKKRQYYVERIDVFILPPDLPPRPDGKCIYVERLNVFIQFEKLMSQNLLSF